jgi:hypothetical protein
MFKMLFAGLRLWFAVENRREIVHEVSHDKGVANRIGGEGCR